VTSPGSAELTGWRRVTFLACAAATAVLVVLVYGFAPGTSEVTLMATTTTGLITCLHDQGIASLWTWCMDLGLPLGSPSLTGLPQIYVGWALASVPGVSAWAANQVVGCAVALLGLAGGFLLLRRWSVPRWLALAATASYLIGPNLLQLNGFAFTFDGFILLPAYVYAAVRVLDLMRAGRWVVAAGATAALCLLMVFTDGYSFFGAAAIIGCLLVAWAVATWREAGVVPAAAGTLIWLVALAGAALTYAAWSPEDSYGEDPYLETFGQLAVDLVTVVIPTGQFLYPELLGVSDRGLPVWGSDTTPATNYLGFLLLGCAALGAVVAARRRSTVDREVAAVAAAAVVTLVLSLGPTLKVAQLDSGLDASLLTLPTSVLYEHVPGFSSLRATNRWLVATRLCVVLLAAVGLAAAARRARSGPRWRSATVVTVAVLAFVEVLPDPAHVVLERRLSLERVRYLDEGIVAEAGRLLAPDELVLMLPSTNDFLANYLVPLAGVRSYNVGIDKNHALSSATWPPAVRAANLGYGSDAQDLICAVLRTDADAVVLPYLDTRGAPLLNGDDPDLERHRERVARVLARDPRFDAEIGEWLTVLRPEPDGGCAPTGAATASRSAGR
jgi:hypothetical protein